MKKVFLLSALVSCIACSYQETDSQSINTVNESSNDSIQNVDKIDLTNTAYFDEVKNYIKKIGEIKEVNASSIEGKEMMVTYYVIYMDSLEISIDRSDRIYVSQSNIHFGNILKEGSIVKPETNYGVPDRNPKLTKEKELKVLEIYKKLIIKALRIN